MKIYTIGFNKKHLEPFILLLRKNSIKQLIDIRLNNTSQLAGYTKYPDFKYLLEEGFQIAYLHDTNLSPTQEILKQYKQDKDFDTYTKEFLKLLNKRTIDDKIIQLIKEKNCCLLCAEETADHCHRRLVAEYIQQTKIPELEMIHL